jgi:hypothetical protein
VDDPVISFASVAKFVKPSGDLSLLELKNPMISFKGAHYPKDIILRSTFILCPVCRFLSQP